MKRRARGRRSVESLTAIGPGMAVFTRHARVLDAQGNALSVREALALINETLDTALAEQ